MANRLNVKSYTIVDFYNYYLLLIEHNTEYDVDMKTYKTIVYEYFKHIRDEIMEKSKRFELPFRLGYFLILKKRPRNFDTLWMRIDWKSTKEEGKYIYMINEHSNYFKYCFHWGKKTCIIPHKTRWMFVASRANKRYLAVIINNKIHDYEEEK